jgi:hypothetical protein
MCRPVLEQCIAKKLNPCPPLYRCFVARRLLVRSLDTLQRAVLVGMLAVETAEEATATKAVAAGLEAMKTIEDGLKTWGIRWEPK